MSPRGSDVRERMLDSTSTLIRQRGASATSLDDILAHSGAPRGSLYYYFPGGRTQLIEETVEHAGASIEQLIASAGDHSPIEVFDAFVKAWRDDLIASSFQAGCPVLAVAIETDDETPQLTDAAARAFTSWRGALRALLRRHGVPPAEARRLANLVVAAIEGAVALSRADRSAQPLDDIARTLRPLLNDAVTRRTKPG
jgi:AcrR family transcriptional regulator